MRGRDLFKRNNKFLKGLAVLLRRSMPKHVLSFLLVISRNFPAKIGIAIRYLVLKALAAECGDNVAIFDGVYGFGWEYMHFGNNVSIHPLCYIDASGGLSIGSDVSIAHNTTIMTTEHSFSDPVVATRDQLGIFSPVVIGDDVWIGAGVRILAGVSIGDHVVVGAGAVVTRDIPSNSLALGVPARVVKEIKKAA